MVHSQLSQLIAVIAVESAIKCSFVYKCTQTRQKGQYKTELTLSPSLHVKPLITAITAICLVHCIPNDGTFARCMKKKPLKILKSIFFLHKSRAVLPLDLKFSLEVHEG